MIVVQSTDTTQQLFAEPIPNNGRFYLPAPADSSIRMSSLIRRLKTFLQVVEDVPASGEKTGLSQNIYHWKKFLEGKNEVSSLHLICKKETNGHPEPPQNLFILQLNTLELCMGKKKKRVQNQTMICPKEEREDREGEKDRERKKELT